MKHSNNGTKIPAESVEGRVSAKGNSNQTTASWTQRQGNAPSGLLAVRKAAMEHKGRQFTALLHHVTVNQLRDSYYAPKRNAASGIDQVTWAEYGQDLEQKLRVLHNRIHKGSYRARPAKRVYIPKPDGSERPLSIWCLEDKIVQQAIVTLLNAIYETDFMGFSYGFKPGRGQHDALDALYFGLHRRRANWVLDADIRKFFDTMNHDWMIRFLQHRIGDKRIIRLIRKWLTAGVMENGRIVRNRRGAPQGAVICPLLANIYLHYVFDLWAHQWRRKKTNGDIIIIRYADDSVLGFQYKTDADRFLKELEIRMKKFDLEIHPDKTKLIRFGRFAKAQHQEPGEGKPDTFDFLGFTHYCTKSKKREWFVVGRKTIKKRMRTQLLEIKHALRERLHAPIPETGVWLRRILMGHLNYYAVPGNGASLKCFFNRVAWYWIRTLRRRSQRQRMTWERFGRLWRRFAPPIRICHDLPFDRFAART